MKAYPRIKTCTRKRREYVMLFGVLFIVSIAAYVASTVDYILGMVQ